MVMGLSYLRFFRRFWGRYSLMSVFRSIFPSSQSCMTLTQTVILVVDPPTRRPGCHPPLAYFPCPYSQSSFDREYCRLCQRPLLPVLRWFFRVLGSNFQSSDRFGRKTCLTAIFAGRRKRGLLLERASHTLPAPQRFSKMIFFIIVLLLIWLHFQFKGQTSNIYKVFLKYF